MPATGAMKNRWAALVLVPLLAGILVVHGPAEQADALSGEETALVPGSVGTLVAAGGEACLAALVVCGAAAVGTAVIGYSGARVLHWIFDDPTPNLRPAGVYVSDVLADVDFACASPFSSTCDPSSDTPSWVGVEFDLAVGSAASWAAEWNDYPGGSGPDGYHLITQDSTDPGGCIWPNAYFVCGAGAFTATGVQIRLRVWQAATVPSPMDAVPAALDWASYTVANPQVRWEITLDCAGTPTTTHSDYFGEEDPEPIVFTDCPGGVMPGGVTVKEKTSAGTEVRTVIDYLSPDPTDFPECLPGGSQYPCRVRLIKVVGTDQQPCTVSAVDCTDFDPDTSTEAEYRCKWGGYDVELADCAILELQPASPSTGLDTDQRLDADPIEPNASPSLVPGQSNTACMGGGWTLNPINWVLKPVKCALVWAFVPSTPMSTYTGQLADAYDGSIIQTGIDMGEEVFGVVPAFTDAADNGDCHGPSIEVEGVTLYPADACADPGAQWAEIVRTFFAFLTAFGGAMTLIRLLMGIWGGPVINSESENENGQGRFVL